MRRRSSSYNGSVLTYDNVLPFLCDSQPHCRTYVSLFVYLFFKYISRSSLLTLFKCLFFQSVNLLYYLNLGLISLDKPKE